MGGIGQSLAARSRHALFWAVRHDFISLLDALLERGAEAAQRDEVCGSAAFCSGTEPLRCGCCIAASRSLGQGAGEGFSAVFASRTGVVALLRPQLRAWCWR